jgi:hypothetical protein
MIVLEVVTFHNYRRLVLGRKGTQHDTALLRRAFFSAARLPQLCMVMAFINAGNNLKGFQIRN